MRDIKFRAWDKERKIMMDVWDIGWKAWDFDNEGYCPINYINAHDGESTEEYFENEVILMQWTGLKDKNGKEIYEGDIVKKFIEGEITVYLIVWFSGTFEINGGEYADIRTGFSAKILKSSSMHTSIGESVGIAQKQNYFFYGGNDGLETKDCEVIGNQYENPKLLEEK